jgi:hypothetical protein
MNIGLGGRRDRRNGGMLMLAGGLLLAVVLVVSDGAREVRLLLLVPFWLGIAGLLQAREGT